jgi:hypothetical protein
MKKHLFGFALFSLIVGTTAFIYAKFNVVSVDEVYTPVDYSTFAQTKSCWKMKREMSESNIGLPIVKQAIFNLRTKQLKWELDRSNIDTPIALNFFVKDKNGTRYINSVLAPMSGYEGGAIISSYLWLDNLDSYENLYITAEPVSYSEYRNKNFRAKFDVSRATPVLLY